MLQWAKGVYDWVRADKRVVGLNVRAVINTPRADQRSAVTRGGLALIGCYAQVWHYDKGPAQGEEYEPGLLGLPTVLRAWQGVGRQILSGKQGDVDFGLPTVKTDDAESRLGG
jgi:hypothetical protein